MLKNDTEIQFNLLKDHVEELNQPITMLNVLRNRTDLDKLETCELEQLLRAIEILTQKHKNHIEQRIAFILGEDYDNE